MAPPKGSLPRRVLGINFLGIDWAKGSFRTPYNNYYPITLTSGNGNRFWSNPHNFGYFANRTGRIHARNAILYVPSGWCFMMTFLQPDWFLCWNTHLRFIGKPFFGMKMPNWAIEKRKEEMRLMARNKPGVLLKHKSGGQVSIPNSETLVAK